MEIETMKKCSFSCLEFNNATFSAILLTKHFLWQRLLHSRSSELYFKKT